LPWAFVPVNFMAQSSCETDGRSADLRHINLRYLIYVVFVMHISRPYQLT
jgi:hypothetical protein